MMLKTLLFASAVSAVRVGSSSAQPAQLNKASLKKVLEDTFNKDNANRNFGDAIQNAKANEADFKKIVDRSKVLADRSAAIKEIAGKTKDGDFDKRWVDLIVEVIDDLNTSAGALLTKVQAAKKSDAKDDEKAHAKMPEQVREVVKNLRTIVDALMKVGKAIKPDFKADKAYENIDKLDKEYPKSKMWIWVTVGIVAAAGVGAGAYFLLRGRN
jgi:hypothetical protein